MDKRQILDWLDATHYLGHGEARVTSVAIDSRKVEPGSLFIPLKGERTDGHNYIEDVLKKGAAVVPVDAVWAEANSDLLARWQGDAFFPVVGDTLLALQDLAKGYLAQFDNLTVVGITGSNGKTTTKEITQSILSQSGASICNEGNLNSDSGLPLSVFRVTSEHRYGVFEMGMNRVGEMSSLARVARPDLALITNVGTAHIGMIGSQQGIAKEKKDIFSYFDGGQVAFVNEMDDFAAYLAKDVAGRVVYYGPRDTAGYAHLGDMGVRGQNITFGGREILFPLPGEYNALNALGAVSVARELGFSEEDIATGLEKCQGGFGRSEVVAGETITLFRDCYNANGDSMKASLSLFSSLHSGKRKVVVLGDMGELGTQAAGVHLAVLKQALSGGYEKIFLLGSLFAEACHSLKDDVDRDLFLCCEEYSALEKSVVDYVKAGDFVLLKGSRSMALERLSEPLLRIK